MEDNGPRILVTVGSTSFDKLVSTILAKSFSQVAKQSGYNSITVQHGAIPVGIKTEIQNKTKFLFSKDDDGRGSGDYIKYDCFEYTNDIESIVKQSDLIISHAGSGSILMSLRLSKPLIVIPNAKLMDNHQIELASALHAQQHLVTCTLEELENVVAKKDYLNLKPYPPSNPRIIGDIINQEVSKLE